jgi:hypothetical protein
VDTSFVERMLHQAAKSYEDAVPGTQAHSELQRMLTGLVLRYPLQTAWLLAKLVSEVEYLKASSKGPIDEDDLPY